MQYNARSKNAKIKMQELNKKKLSREEMDLYEEAIEQLKRIGC